MARGEFAGVRLSGGERSLLQFAQDKFGEHLTRFLLSGLGEKGVARRRLFVITFASGGRVLRRRVYVEADDLRPDRETFLPRGREPLALLALIRLFVRGRGVSSSRLSYSLEEVLGLLGWQDADESRLVIDEAVGRYFYLDYRWALSRAELAVKNLSFYRSHERLIAGSGRDEVEEGGRRRRVSNHVEFNTEFLRGMMSHMLFGVDWNSVRRVSRKDLC